MGTLVIIAAWIAFNMVFIRAKEYKKRKNKKPCNEMNYNTVNERLNSGRIKINGGNCGPRQFNRGNYSTMRFCREKDNCTDIYRKSA